MKITLNNNQDLRNILKFLNERYNISQVKVIPNRHEHHIRMATIYLPNDYRKPKVFEIPKTK